MRLKPFIYADHFFLIPVDFDEGVYYGASVLLTKGILPYRDFDFGHPPGIVWLFGLWHWIVPQSSVAHSFALAKVAMAILGSFTSVGVFILGKRWHGPVAGIIGAVLYATYPEVVASDRSLFLEPLINAAVVLAFLLYDTQKRPWIAIGLLLGWAISVKVTAVVWIPAFAWIAWQSGRYFNIARFASGGCLGILFFFVPWILIDPAKFWEGVIQFQMGRPPDGDVALMSRLSSILRDQHFALNIFSAIGLLVWPWSDGKRRTLGAAASLALVFASIVLLSSKGYWSQYNTLLAMPQALLATFSATIFVSASYRRWILAAVGIFLIAFPIRSAFKGGRARSVEQLKLVQSIEEIPHNACVFSFEPGWLIMSNHFPSPCSGRLVLDTYLVMLMDAREAGQRFDSTAAAFATDESQKRVLPSLLSADVVVLGPRGQAQVNGSAKARILEDFQPRDELLFNKRHIGNIPIK
ncbi:MAG TPA: glycosyltransferase family 39 protein [Oligoflexus sp.]|uniref:ArnT family glycosyltransferase n=1 Tax=Oligoflexus sp. TaxID=1971216 RepID=UPI002D7F0D67|nr:glycosyltransferase family 39 protein [Oligoflexus sp.]HET9239299.1 glycosyltransferase family 39 protein [Oligoflexus sp.]